VLLYAGLGYGTIYGFLTQNTVYAIYGVIWAVYVYRISSVFLRAPAASTGVLTYAIIAYATDLCYRPTTYLSVSLSL